MIMHILATGVGTVLIMGMLVTLGCLFVSLASRIRPNDAQKSEFARHIYRVKSGK